MVRTVLLLSKGRFDPPHFVADLVEVAERDQRFLHPWNWQQPLEEYEYLVSRLTRPNEIIFDGTCGSGGVGEAVVRVGGGRRAILCDVDEKCVRIARKRVAEALVIAEGA
jgi:DNA modification methylase